MLRRVSSTVLLGLVLVLSLALTAIAQPAQTGSADAAIAVGEAQLGKPFQYGAEGPDAFSCVGLMRYVLKTAGVDDNAPWVPEEYLSTYAPVAPGDLQPGDIVIYPDWATMYVGDGMLLNANEVDRQVTLTPIGAAGEPLGVVRPYDGQEANTPAATNNNSEGANTPAAANTPQGADDTDGGNGTGMNLDIFQYLMRLLQSLGF